MVPNLVSKALGMAISDTMDLDGTPTVPKQKVFGPMIKTVPSLELGRETTQIAIRVELGPRKILHVLYVSEQQQLRSTAKLEPGSVQMAPLRALGRWIRNNMMVPGSSVTEPQDNSILMTASKVADPGGQMITAKGVLGL